VRAVKHQIIAIHYRDGIRVVEYGGIGDGLHGGIDPRRM